MWASPKIPEQLQDSLRAEYRYGPLAALPVAVQRTYQMSLMTVRMLGRMATGQLGLDHLSGPINIAQYAGYPPGSVWCPIWGSLRSSASAWGC